MKDWHFFDRQRANFLRIINRTNHCSKRHCQISCIYPGFAKRIEATPPKGLEILGKTRIPTFTRCPTCFLQFGFGKSLECKENPLQVLETARPSGKSGFIQCSGNSKIYYPYNLGPAYHRASASLRRR